jgi:cytochrome c peroxidase
MKAVKMNFSRILLGLSHVQTCLRTYQRGATLKGPRFSSDSGRVHRRAAFVLGATWLLTLVITLNAGGGTTSFLTAVNGIFRPFRDDSGFVQSLPSDVTVSTAAGAVVPVTAPLDSSNIFFAPNAGISSSSGNEQGCVTCHQPGQGFTIHVEFINDTFAANPNDPLFRFNDTADNPSAGAPTADNYSIVLNQGAIRIGEVVSPNGTPDYTVTAASPAVDAKFAFPDHFPLTTDPQHPGVQTLSVFRRPLVNTNVHLDSSVLWDGRASIGNMRAQATGAVKTLLLVTPTPDQADQIVAFMLGVYTDQVFDKAAGTDANGNCTLTAPGQQCGSGATDSAGATGGIQKLVSFALSPSVPCNTPDPANLLQTSATAGGQGCVANVPGYDLFDAWAALPDSGINSGRLSVVRGQNLFNNAVLHVPSDLMPTFNGATEIHCSTCHSKHDTGNNSDATFFARIGTDSPKIISDLIASHPSDADALNGLLGRVNTLPLYCVRPTGQTADCTDDQKTTDPGRALFTGKIADLGKFKPPVLRGLAARSPYFHAGTAENIQALVHFYNARFNIGLTDAQINDLGAFLEDQ